MIDMFWAIVLAPVVIYFAAHAFVDPRGVGEIARLRARETMHRPAPPPPVDEN